MQKMQSLKGMKLEPLTSAQMQSIKGGDTATTATNAPFQGMCQEGTLGGTKTWGANTATPTTVTYSSDVRYTDGNGNYVGTTYK